MQLTRASLVTDIFILMCKYTIDDMLWWYFAVCKSSYMHPNYKPVLLELSHIPHPFSSFSALPGMLSSGYSSSHCCCYVVFHFTHLRSTRPKEKSWQTMFCFLSHVLVTYTHAHTRTNTHTHTHPQTHPWAWPPYPWKPPTKLQQCFSSSFFILKDCFDRLWNNWHAEKTRRQWHFLQLHQRYPKADEQIPR